MRISFPLTLLLTAILTVTTAQAATRTWTGGGGDDNRFTTAANWAENLPAARGDYLIFPANAQRFTPFCDIGMIGWSEAFEGLIFEGGNYQFSAAAYASAVRVNAGNQDLGGTWWKIRGIYVADGASLAANVYGKYSDFTIDGPGITTLSINGSNGGTVVKQGTGTSSISTISSLGVNLITVNGGRLNLTTNSGNQNGPITVYDGTLQGNYIRTRDLKISGSGSELIGSVNAGTFEVSNGAKFSPTSCGSAAYVTVSTVLTGGILNPAFAACDGDPRYYLIRTELPNPVTGNFVNYPEGTTFMIGGRLFKITYRGGDGNDVQVLPAPGVSSDFDANRKTDISLFRSSDSTWYVQNQTGFAATQWGLPDDKIAPADYDGDGKADIAVYRPSEGIWYILNSENGTVSYKVFGLAGDLPTPADYDGDGKADISVFRPSTGTWYRVNSLTGTFSGRQFGTSGDKPTLGDFDGDGKADLAVFRPPSGAWYRVNSSTGAAFGEQFGIATDLLVPADYDGDGRTDLGVYRPLNGYWYIKNSATTTYEEYNFGLADDIPSPGDFDGDGKTDICVFRPSEGIWYRQNSSGGAFVAIRYGTSGDKPIMTAFHY